MSSARERILDRIRAATGAGRDGGAGVAPAQRMARPPQLIRPRLQPDLLLQFEQKLALGGGSCERLGSLQEVAGAVVRFLEAKGLPARVRLAPALSGMDWGDRLEVSYGNSRGDDLVSLTPAFCAVAETGSLVLLSSGHSPTSLNFLPDYHLVLVTGDQLVPHLEDAWQKLRATGEVPRAINLITGPSKTADIEQTLQIGAHGPRSLHVFLLSGD